VGAGWSGGEAAILSGGVGCGRGSGHGVSYHFLLAWDVLDVTGVLRYVRQMAALAQCPGIHHPCQGEHDGHMVGEYGELTTIKHVPEVPDASCACQQFPVEKRSTSAVWDLTH
jgi:hypothetical protein